MVDAKIITLLTLAQMGSYTRTAEALSLTQPAVSNHIRLLEREFNIKIFYRDKKKLHATPEGDILLKYARRAVALSARVRQDIEDSKRSVRSLTIGITPTAEENLVPRMLASYCSRHPDVHVNIRTENIKMVLNMLKAFELDLAIVEGTVPDGDLVTLLLDTDYLCLAVAPAHPFARKPMVTLEELKKENLILRLPNTGTRNLFETQLRSRGEDIRNFHVMMELDNLSIIKELVSCNMGVTIISYSACQQEIKNRRLVSVPLSDMHMTREINLVYPQDFQHPEILRELRQAFWSKEI